MDNFPPNSHGLTKSEPEAEPKPEKLNKIVTGKVLRRKQPLGKRFMETFFGGTNTVWSYILHDILLPAAKDTITDVVSQGVERMVYGESRSTSRRTGARPSGTSGYVSYNRFSQGPRGAREETRATTTRRGTHDFQDVILTTRAEAEGVIDTLYSLVEKYNQVTVSDLYDLLGIPTQFTDENWGWTDISSLGRGPIRVQGGYLLNLPKPDFLN
jgi:hypothetical protein